MTINRNEAASFNQAMQLTGSLTSKGYSRGYSYDEYFDRSKLLTRGFTFDAKDDTELDRSKILTRGFTVPADLYKMNTTERKHKKFPDDEVNDKESHENNDDIRVDEVPEEFSPSSYRNDDFFAESPYFGAFVDKEIHSTEVAKETMNDIASKTKDFAQSGMKMVMETRRLASSCRLDPTGNSTSAELKSKRKALEPEVVDGLECIGDVLEEISCAQEHLCLFLKSYLVSNMQSIFAKENKIIPMRDEAQKETDEAELLFTKYLHGGINACGGNLEGSEGGTQPELCSKGEDSNQHSITRQVAAPVVAQWKHDLKEIRVLQTSAQLKRYQLATHIVDLKYQQNTDISICASQMVSEMCAYFSHCSNLVSELLHLTTHIEGQCEEFQSNHEKRRWGEREKLLEKTLASARQAQTRSQLQLNHVSLTTATTTPSSSQVLEPSSSSCKKKDINAEEENVQIWDLPATLASYTGHSRPTAAGVFMEGWLYKKTAGSSSLYRSTTWSRSWFLVRKDGLFEFSTEDYRDSFGKSKICQYDDSTRKVKICNLQLCSVKNVKVINQDFSNRFCFELITPTNYSSSNRLVLQARGPHELQMWTNAIRLGISCQLAAGESQINMNQSSLQFPFSRGSIDNDPPVDTARNSIVQRFRTRIIPSAMSNNPQRRMSSEIRLTILERGRSLFFTYAPEKFNASFTENDDLGQETRELMKANPTCADCGEESPDWASLNLGILICLKCSGVHRSLGVHISKVRSLTLDTLSNRESKLLLSLGNTCANQFWEKEAPIESEERKADRENWIRRKYVKKEFIGSDSPAKESAGENTASRNLYEASKRADIIDIAKAIAHGGRVSWKNPEEENKTAIEVCGANLQENGKLAECEEFLLQNGA